MTYGNECFLTYLQVSAVVSIVKLLLSKTRYFIEPCVINKEKKNKFNFIKNFTYLM